MEHQIAHVGQNRPILLALGALRQPFRISHEAIPFRLALCKGFPLQEVINVCARRADEDRPKGYLPDTVPLPQIKWFELPSSPKLPEGLYGLA